MKRQTVSVFGILALAGGLCFAGSDGDGNVVERITNLSSNSVDTLSVTLKWSAPSAWDAMLGVTTAAERYELRYGGPATNNIYDWDHMTPVTAGLDPGAPGELQSATVYGLSPGTSYTFLIRVWFRDAWDWSNFLHASTIVDSSPPGTIADLGVTALSDSSVQATWTAAGDDGAAGQAATIELRYSAAGPILTSAEFDAATPVPGMPAPAAAGVIQTRILDGLAPSTTYWFAIRAVDEVANLGALAPASPSATTAPREPKEKSETACGAHGTGRSVGLVLAAALGLGSLLGRRRLPLVSRG